MSDFFDSEPARDAKKREESERSAKEEERAKSSSDAGTEKGFDTASGSPPRTRSEHRNADRESTDDSEDTDDNDDASDDSEDAAGPPKVKRVPKRKTRGFVEVKKPEKPKQNQDSGRGGKGNRARDKVTPDQADEDNYDDEDNEDDDDDQDDRAEGNRGAQNSETRPRGRDRSQGRLAPKDRPYSKSRTPINKKLSLDSQLRESNARREKDREDEDAENFDDEDYEDPDYDDKFAIRVFEAEDQNLIQKYFSHVNAILFNPKKFFAALPPEGVVAPTIFLCVSAAIYAFLQALGHLNPLLLFSSFFSSIFYTAGGAVIVWAVFNKACKGRGTLVETYRVLAYSKATLLFGWIMAGSIPLGGYLSVAYTLFLNYIGLKKVHRLNTMMTAGIVMALGALAFAFKKMMPF